MKFSGHNKNGFTLIETMVAVFVFSIVMTLATASIFNIVSANKTSQAIKSVMDNLSSALDSMSREIRYGSTFNCGNTGSGPLSCPDDLAGNDHTKFGFSDRFGVHTVYEFVAEDSGVGDGSGSIYRCSPDTQATHCVRLTAPEVHITNLHFYVRGSTAGEAEQPILLTAISGYAQAGANKSSFNIETMTSQRNPVCKQGMMDLDICH
jgi:prepilin-type N-terminal cleavage/methylation domain-containing protein